MGPIAGMRVGPDDRATPMHLVRDTASEVLHTQRLGPAMWNNDHGLRMHFWSALHPFVDCISIADRAANSVEEAGVFVRGISFQACETDVFTQQGQGRGFCIFSVALRIGF